MVSRRPGPWHFAAFSRLRCLAPADRRIRRNTQGPSGCVVYFPHCCQRHPAGSHHQLCRRTTTDITNPGKLAIVGARTNPPRLCVGPRCRRSPDDRRRPQPPIERIFEPKPGRAVRCRVTVGDPRPHPTLQRQRNVLQCPGSRTSRAVRGIAVPPKFPFPRLASDLWRRATFHEPFGVRRSCGRDGVRNLSAGADLVRNTRPMRGFDAPIAPKSYAQ